MQVTEVREIRKKVMEVVSRNAVFNEDKVNEDSVIKRDHGIDSIKLVELVIDLEEEFDIEVEANLLTLENFATIELITKYVMDKVDRQ